MLFRLQYTSVNIKQYQSVKIDQASVFFFLSLNTKLGNELCECHVQGTLSKKRCYKSWHLCSYIYSSRMVQWMHKLNGTVGTWMEHRFKKRQTSRLLLVYQEPWVHYLRKKNERENNIHFSDCLKSFSSDVSLLCDMHVW